MDEINRYKERLQIALTAAKICIFEVNILQQLYTYFENAEVIFGVSGEEILKDVQPFSKLGPVEYRKAASAYFSHPEDEAVIEAAFKDILEGKASTYEARMRAGGSRYVWCRIHVTPIIENGVPARMVGVIADISDHREQTENLKKAVNVDAFTELFNKEYAIALIRECLRKSKELNHALIILDIDNFKNYNDTFGHSEGDKVIKAVSRKIRDAFRETDILGRFGGDEFILLVRDIKNMQLLNGKLSDLTHFQVGGITCTTSIGISIFPQDAAGYRELFEKADTALYQAKAQKGTFIYYQE